MHHAAISLNDYHYDLPDDRIARFPLAERDQSKLLFYRQGQIHDHAFADLPGLLPDNCNLFFNNTKVIPARLYFQKESGQHETGATIEVFLLHPVQPGNIISQAMLATESCSWQCVIGNQKKWKPGIILKKVVMVNGQEVILQAELTNREQKLVTFRWEYSRLDKPHMQPHGEPHPLGGMSELSFADIVEASGQVPLPPYLKREATEEDKPRYQTVYSKQQGAVAAPTAGLHFTHQVLETIQQKGIALNYLTLHVSASTFQPIKEEIIQQHPMHSEQMVITQENLHSLLNKEKKVVAVGTTSMRTLESLYWYGVQLIKEGDANFFVRKLSPYQYPEDKLPDAKAAVAAVLHHMQQHELDTLVGETEIFIFPGYTFRICQGLVTNFHMPKSTLVLLIAAFIGEDWRKVYAHALTNQYRFLSYGDSSLLLTD